MNYLANECVCMHSKNWLIVCFYCVFELVLFVCVFFVKNTGGVLSQRPKIAR